MSMHAGSVTKGVEGHVIRVPVLTGSCTPGIIPAKTVEKRRAKNKAARRSRAKNR